VGLVVVVVVMVVVIAMIVLHSFLFTDFSSLFAIPHHRQQSWAIGLQHPTNSCIPVPTDSRFCS
jgi:hypothetical protein